MQALDLISVSIISTVKYFAKGYYNERLLISIFMLSWYQAK